MGASARHLPRAGVSVAPAASGERVAKGDAVGLLSPPQARAIRARTMEVASRSFPHPGFLRGAAWFPGQAWSSLRMTTSG